MFHLLTKKNTVAAIEEQLSTIACTINNYNKNIETESVADKLYLSIFLHNMYKFGNKEHTKEFVQFLYKNMRYRDNNFNNREVFEIYLSYFFPTLYYHYPVKVDKSSFVQHIPYTQGYGASRRNERMTITAENWPKENFAEVLFNNCDRKDFLRLLIDYNRHDDVYIAPEKEQYRNIIAGNITKDSALYALCTQFFTISSGFKLGFNVALLDNYNDNDGDKERRDNEMTNDLNNKLSALFK